MVLQYLIVFHINYRELNGNWSNMMYVYNPMMHDHHSSKNENENKVVKFVISDENKTFNLFQIPEKFHLLTFFRLRWVLDDHIEIGEQGTFRQST